jgi:hypothetical protein
MDDQARESVVAHQNVASATEHKHAQAFIASKLERCKKIVPRGGTSKKVGRPTHFESGEGLERFIPFDFEMDHASV